MITGDHSYEVIVELDVRNSAQGGLLLFYNKNCFVGLDVTASLSITTNWVKS